MGARKAKLDDEALVLAEDRVAFTEMEAKARSSLRTLYNSGLESPLAGAKDGPAKLLLTPRRAGRPSPRLWPPARWR